MRHTVAVTALLVLSVSLHSCLKRINTPSVPSGTFYFRLHTYIDSTEVTDTAALYRDSTGRHFGLSVAQFFIYDVVLQYSNGTTYKVPNAYILKDIDSERYIIGAVPPGSYSSVTFNVGLDPTTNAISPANFAPAGSYIPTATMQFDSSGGYMYMDIQGFADTTATQNGTNLVYFSYQIGQFITSGGADIDLQTVVMPTRGKGSYTSYAPYTLAVNGSCYIDIICDYGKLLSVVNFKTQDTTNTYDVNPALAPIIASNEPNMFRYGQ
jgi:hypothetical protein